MVLLIMLQVFSRHIPFVKYSLRLLSLEHFSGGGIIDSLLSKVPNDKSLVTSSATTDGVPKQKSLTYDLCTFTIGNCVCRFLHHIKSWAPLVLDGAGKVVLDAEKVGAAFGPLMEAHAVSDAGYFDAYSRIISISGSILPTTSSAASAKGNLFSACFCNNGSDFWSSMATAWQAEMKHMRRPGLSTAQVKDCDVIESALTPMIAYSTGCKVMQRISAKFVKSQLRKLVRGHPQVLKLALVDVDSFRLLPS